MRVSTTVCAVFMAIGLAWTLSACDGEGLFVPINQVSGGDNRPGGSSDGGGNTPPSSNDNRFAGSWAAAYCDDIVTPDATTGKIYYVVRLSLTQNRTVLSGTGRVLRVFTEGSTAYDAQPLTFSVSGATTNDDATLRFLSTSGRPFDFEPVWHLRLCNNRIVGMYAASKTDNTLVRSGVALWRRVSSATMSGLKVATLSDRTPSSPPNRLDRVGELNLTVVGTTPGDLGNFYLQRETDTPLTQAFSITGGVVNGAELFLRFGAEDLVQTPMSVFAIHDGVRLLAAYAQFSGGRLNWAGTAVWYPTGATTPGAFTHTWASSFGDTSTASVGGTRRSDYVGVLNLTANDGNVLSGTASILDESASTPAYRSYTVRAGSTTGTRAQFELHDSGTGTTFSWDAQLGGDVLIGSYIKYSNSGAYLSRGVAEWRYQSTAFSLAGTWTASFLDTYGEAEPEANQLALITVGTPTSTGDLSGSGALRFAGDTSRRLFNMTGSVSGSEITWRWSGSGLVGDIVWHLRPTTNGLVGTYTNYTSNNALESRGCAVFFKTSTSAQFAQ